MPLDRMIPDLQASFVCEDVRVEASGAHTIVGVVNFIGAPTLPIQVIKLCVWTRWSSGVGQFEQVTRLLGPDEETLLAPPAVTHKLCWVWRKFCRMSSSGTERPCDGLLQISDSDEPAF